MRNGMPATHPGEHLRDELDWLGMSANAFAAALGVPTNRITGILNGTRAISADTALRLARYFGTTAQFWLNLQNELDLREMKMKIAPELERINVYSHSA